METLQQIRQAFQNMPRTMLRYTIEKFEENQHQQYLKGKI